MHPKDLSIKDFSYELPHDRIAKYPLAQRDQSKLLLYKDGVISEDVYAHLDQHLPEHSLLVFNNTRVVEARLLFEKANGGRIEIFCLEPDSRYRDISAAMLQKGEVQWICLVGGAKKWKEGSLHLHIQKTDGSLLTLTALKKERLADAYLVALAWDDKAMSFAEVLHVAGQLPLPPYLNRAVESSDTERYQTIYARHDGSVAAPTAGLHFTETVLASLRAKNIGQAFVTLHVGAGTFKPVKSDTMEQHEMHAECIDVHKDFIQQLIYQPPGTVIAVGTTSLRTLESLYWLGVKTVLDPAIHSDALQVSQWEPYELSSKNTSAASALQSLLEWMDRNHTTRLITKTQIIIAPGYHFRIIRALVTNFHQPQSTLLLLVAALAGNDWKKIYDYALLHDFRFLSYGDGSLLWNNHWKDED